MHFLPVHPTTLQWTSLVHSFDWLPAQYLGFGLLGNFFPLGLTMHFGASLQSSWLKQLSSIVGRLHFFFTQCLRLQSFGVLQGFCVPWQIFAMTLPFGLGAFGLGGGLTHFIGFLQSWSFLHGSEYEICYSLIHKKVDTFSLKIIFIY